MRGDRYSWVAGLVMIAAPLAGCSSEAPTTPTAPVPTAASPSPSPTPSPADPFGEYAIPEDPADIDEAYVERVLEALSVGYVEATREVASSTRITRRLSALLSETHTRDARRSLVEDFRSVLRDHPKAGPLARDPSAPVIQVREIIEAEANCIFALVQQDFSGIVRGGGIDPYPAYYYLVSRETGPGRLNPTPWLIAGTGEPNEDGEEYENPCA